MRASIFLNKNHVPDDLKPIPRLEGEVSGVGKPPTVSAVAEEGSSTVGVVVDDGFKPAAPSMYDAWQQVVAFNWPEDSRANQDFVAHLADEIWKTTPDAARTPVTAFVDKADAQAAPETKIAHLAHEIGTWFNGRWNDEHVKQMAFKIAAMPFSDMPLDMFAKHEIFKKPVFWKNLEDQTMWLGEIDPKEPRMDLVLKAVGDPIDWTKAEVGKAPLDIPDASLIPWESIILPFPWKAVNWSAVPTYDAMAAVRNIAQQLKVNIGAATPAARSDTTATSAEAQPASSTQKLVESPAETAERLAQSQAEIEKLKAAIVQLERSITATEPPPPKPSLMPLLGWTAVLGTVGYILYKTVNMKKEKAT